MGALSLVSLVLRIEPQKRTFVEAALTALAGVECHAMSDAGKLIVTAEDTPGAALSDTLIAIHRIPDVLAATLAFESNEAFSSDLSGRDSADPTDSRLSEELSS